MSKDRCVLTRRDFIRAGSTITLGGILGLPVLGSSPQARPVHSRVVVIRDESVLDAKGNPRADVLQTMLDQAMGALTGINDPAGAWQSLFKPTDTVGIKTNAWNYIPTPPALEAAIERRLRDVGIPPEKMAVDDRGIRTNPVFEQATALVNVRPMRTHHWAGLGTLIKNYIMFVPRPSDYHANACERLGEIWTLPQIKGKTRLNILVMLTPLFHGIGPHHYSSAYTWPYSGLIVSTDPVAADSTGARIIQAKRLIHFKGERPISPPPHHIAIADTRFGLGVSDPSRIELLRLGWKTDSLI